MPRKPLPVIRSCDEHTVRIESYLNFHADADLRHKRGERQGICAECGLWSWPRDPAKASSR